MVIIKLVTILLKYEHMYYFYNCLILYFYFYNENYFNLMNLSRVKVTPYLIRAKIIIKTV